MNNIVLQIRDYTIDAAVIALAIASVFLVKHGYAYYKDSKEADFLPQVTSAEVRFGDGEWEQTTLPIAINPKPAERFQVRLTVNVPSLLYTTFNFRQEFIHSLTVNGQNVPGDFPYHTEDAYKPNLQKYLQKGENVFVATVSDRGNQADFDLRPILVSLRDAEYRIEGGEWIPFTSKVAHPLEQEHSGRSMVRFDAVIPPLHSGRMNFVADRIFGVQVNGIEVKDDFPVIGYGVYFPDLSDYLVVPGVNSFVVDVHDGGSIHNFEVRFANNDESIIIFAAKAFAFLMVLFYGTWRLRQSY